MNMILSPADPVRIYDEPQIRFGGFVVLRFRVASIFGYIQRPASWWWWRRSGPRTSRRYVMIIAILLASGAIAMLAWIVFNLAVYALPFFVGRQRGITGICARRRLLRRGACRHCQWGNFTRARPNHPRDIALTRPAHSRARRLRDPSRGRRIRGHAARRRLDIAERSLAGGRRPRRRSVDRRGRLCSPHHHRPARRSGHRFGSESDH